MTTVDRLANLPHVVYRCYDVADRLLYIGATYNFEQRWQQHLADNKRWPQRTTRWLFHHFPDRASAMDNESFSIQVEWPKYNRYPKSRTRRPFGPVTEREYVNDLAWRLIAEVRPRALSCNYYEKRGRGRPHHWADERLMRFASWHAPSRVYNPHEYWPSFIPDGTYWRRIDAAEREAQPLTQAA